MTLPHIKIIRAGQTQIIYATCPKCGTKGRIDEEQFRGKVSMICPNPECGYHETHNLFARQMRKTWNKIEQICNDEIPSPCGNN